MHRREETLGVKHYRFYENCKISLVWNFNQPLYYIIPLGCSWPGKVMESGFCFPGLE